MYCEDVRRGTLYIMSRHIYIYSKSHKPIAALLDMGVYGRPLGLFCSGLLELASDIHPVHTFYCVRTVHGSCNMEVCV